MCIYTDLIRIGNTSVTVHVEAWVIRRNQTDALGRDDDRGPLALCITARRVADEPQTVTTRVACWRGRRAQLKLFCISLAAFGIERAVRRLDILEALSGLRNGPSDSEIIGLSFDHQPVSPGRKQEIGVLWT
jgi:hypothetical protein